MVFIAYPHFTRICPYSPPPSWFLVSDFGKGIRDAWEVLTSLINFELEYRVRDPKYSLAKSKASYFFPKKFIRNKSYLGKPE